MRASSRSVTELAFHVKHARAIAVVAALLFAAGSGAAAELKVMVTGSMANPLKEIAETFAKRNGHTANVISGITATVTATLQAGEMTDVVEVTSVGMDQLEKEKLILPGSRIEIARALIGVAVREGARVPDISTADAVKRTLLEARSVTFVNPRFGGQVSANLKAFLDRLGIAEEVSKKVSYAFTGEEAVEKVVKGEADIVLAFVSEILPVKGVKWLGPLPATLQFPTSYSAAIGAGSTNPELARALLAAIMSPEGRRVITDTGLEPVAH
jgi:molybdate transport system substrate-binding protein